MNIQVPTKLAYRVDEASCVSGISRSSLFLAIKEGKLKSVKVGGSRLIHADELRRFLKIEGE